MNDNKIINYNLILKYLKNRNYGFRFGSNYATKVESNVNYLVILYYITYALNLFEKFFSWGYFYDYGFQPIAVRSFKMGS